MPEAPDIPTAWSRLLERKPGTRGADDDSLPAIAEAAHAEPRLRALYPIPTHGTLQFVRSAPPWPDTSQGGLPFIIYGGSQYQVYTSGYRELLGKTGSPAEAVALVVGNLPPEAGAVDE